MSEAVAVITNVIRNVSDFTRVTVTDTEGNLVIFMRNEYPHPCMRIHYINS
ncbi:DUF4222 domain-containing protein [Escherichia coli]|nr:DUF4222 domain-containing protein [Escherichia coli]